MQLISSYLYPNRLDVYTSAPDWNNLRYRKVYNRNLKIYRSVDNRIDLQIRNCDQKAFDLSTITLAPGQTITVVFNVISREGKILVLSKDAESFTLTDGSTSSSTKGQVRVNLTANDLAGLEPGYYDYSIVQEIRTTLNDNEHIVVSRTVLYADSQYGAISTLEVENDVLGQVEQSVTVDTFLLKDPRAQDNSVDEFYVSSIIDTQRPYQVAQSLHTFQFYCTAYTGRVEIQGSLDKDSDPKNWVTIRTRDAVNETSFYENVVGKYNWFRIKHSTDDVGNAKFTVGQNTNGAYSVSVYDGGASYVVGDVITIIGSVLGGANGVNDLNITVTSVNYAGSIVAITWSGTSINNTRSFVLGGTGEPSSGTIDKVLYR